MVTDPELPGSVNVATMLAGRRSWLPVTPRLRGRVRPADVAMDLRGRWKKNIDAYRWFYATYGRQLHRPGVRVPTIPASSSSATTSWNSRFRWFGSRIPKDAQRSRTASPAEEEQFARELFLKLPPNIPCLGWWDHGQGGEEGIGEGPYGRRPWPASAASLRSARAGTVMAAAWAISRSTRAPRRRSGRRSVRPAALADKVYWTYTRTDGDGPNFWRQVYRNLWDQPEHGKVPVGWQLGPTAYDLIPDILDYFYRHATPGDVFVNALTGIGYIHEDRYAEKLPESQREAVWERYLELSSRYFKRWICRC